MSPAASAPAHGLMAEFRDQEALLAALDAARAAGFTAVDAYSPHPVAQAAHRLGVRTWPIPITALTFAVLGAGLTYGAEYWTNVIDYPLNVGGRPLHAWPAFLMSALITSFLWAAIGILLSLLVMTGLPRPHHPVFDVAGFERASSDRFFLCIRAEDPRFDPRDTATFLGGLDALSVREAP